MLTSTPFKTFVSIWSCRLIFSAVMRAHGLTVQSALPSRVSYYGIQCTKHVQQRLFRAFGNFITRVIIRGRPGFFYISEATQFLDGAPPWSIGSVLDHRSLPPVFESRRGHIIRLFHL